MFDGVQNGVIAQRREKDLILDKYQGQKLTLPQNISKAKQQSTQVEDNMACVFKCTSVQWCRSINLHLTPQSSGLLDCELLSSDQFTSKSYMTCTQDMTYSHYSVKNPCQKIPCRNDGECIFEDNRRDYRCQCKIGFTGEHCENDIDECSSGSHSCHAQAQCTNTDGSYTCQCQPGYHGDGRTCTDINECSSGSHSCNVNADCTNTAGSYTCQCKSGYHGDGRTCTSVSGYCSSYTSITDANRNVGYKTKSSKCDDKIAVKWYRLTGSAGSRMPTSCSPVSHCETSATGWLSDSHPSTQQGIVYRKVCFHWNGNCCSWNIMIRVLNCGSFYLYEFKPTPNCSLRYCGAA